MNLSDARTRLAERGFDYLSGASMNLMLNRARNDFEDYWQWPWLYRMASGAGPLVIPDLKYVVLVKDADTHRELLGLDVRQVEQGDVDITVAGPPTNWWISDDGPGPKINQWPAGDVTLTVRYIAESPELVSDSDSPLIPPRYQSVWIDFAVVQAYRDSDNFPAAQALSADTLARLQLLVERYESRNRQNPARITERSFNDDD